jgi:hypothetical protein
MTGGRAGSALGLVAFVGKRGKIHSSLALRAGKNVSIAIFLRLGQRPEAIRAV